MTDQRNNKRIAKNTLFLYIRMLFIMAINLYISRVVLNALGVEDFGIYNVVGGVVLMFSFLNGAMAAGTQRFLSYELGAENISQLNKVFNVAIFIHFFIGLAVIILAETVGLWFFNTQMNIPDARIDAARWVYQFAIFSFFLSVVQVPYIATIIAHEKMNVYACIGIFEVFLKLGVALVLSYVVLDKLKLYALLLLFVVGIITCVYIVYCRKKFNECVFQFLWDRKLFDTMVSYAGWSLFGSAASMVSNQGLNILLNIFFNPTINAARAIAFQVNMAIQSFTTNFQMAVNPQIVKSYAKGDRPYMMSLIFQSSKYSFFLLYLIALPVLFETDTLLKIWLKLVPEYASVFCKLVIIDALIGCVSYPLMMASQATGKIRLYQVVVGSILLLNLPFVYILLRLGYGPEYSMYVSIFLSVIALCARLIMLKELILLDIKKYIKSVIIKSLMVGGVGCIIPFFVTHYLSSGSILFFLLNSILCVLCSLLSIYFFGFDEFEKRYVRNRIVFVVKKVGI